MHIGITGTRYGMTAEQKTRLIQAVEKFKPEFIHHGDCVGADSDAHDIAVKRGIDIHIHPPIEGKLRKFNNDYKSIEECKNYFARNRDIVNSSDVTLGFPKQNTRQHKGGTWYTIKYAEKQGKKLYIIYPDGRVESSGGES